MTTLPDRIESVGKETGSVLSKLKKFDDERPGFPGEHLFAFAVGSLMLLAARRGRSPLRRAMMMTAGSAFIGRAASGRGGLARLASVLRRL